MIAKFLSLTIVFVLFCAPILEAKEEIHPKKELKTASFVIKSANSDLSTYIEVPNCEDKGCHDHDTHCVHHCTGLHNLIENKQSIKLNCELGVDSKITWYFNFHYDEPFLDPALKPPLFS